MVTPQSVNTESSLRALLEAHAAELVRERQEVRIRLIGVDDDFVGAIEEYVPNTSTLHDEEDRDMLYLEVKKRAGYVFYLREIAELELFPRAWSPEGRGS